MEGNLIKTCLLTQAKQTVQKDSFSQNCNLKNVALIPSPILRGFFNHSIEKEPYVFSTEEEEPLKMKSHEKNLIEDFSLAGWTPQMIEVLFTVFFLREDDKVIFKSKNHFASLSSGANTRSSRNRSKYFEAIQALQEPVMLLIKGGNLSILINEPFLYKDGENCFRIGIPFLRYADSWLKVPLAINEIFRAGGLSRVERPHILLYLYLLNQFRDKRKENFDAKKIIKSIGIEHYFKQKHGNRAYQLINDSLNALVDSKVILSYEFLGKEIIKIKPNPFHFESLKGKLYTNGEELYTSGVKLYTNGEGIFTEQLETTPRASNSRI